MRGVVSVRCYCDREITPERGHEYGSRSAQRSRGRRGYLGFEPIDNLCGISCIGCADRPSRESVAQCPQRSQRRMARCFGAQEFQVVSSACAIAFQNAVDHLVDQHDGSRMRKQIQLAAD